MLKHNLREKCRRESRQYAAEKRGGDGENEADGDDEEEHAYDIAPGSGVIGLELFPHGGRHMLPNVVLAMRFPVRSVSHKRILVQ